jgi:hypothetical protein
LTPRRPVSCSLKRGTRRPAWRKPFVTVGASLRPTDVHGIGHSADCGRPLSRLNWGSRKRDGAAGWQRALWRPLTRGRLAAPSCSSADVLRRVVFGGGGGVLSRWCRAAPLDSYALFGEPPACRRWCRNATGGTTALAPQSRRVNCCVVRTFGAADAAGHFLAWRQRIWQHRRRRAAGTVCALRQQRLR